MTRLQVEVGLVALVTMGSGTAFSTASDTDPTDPWAQGMVSLVTARKEAIKWEWICSLQRDT